MRALSLSPVLAVLLISGPAADAATLVPHRAVYDLVIDRDNNATDGTTALKGRIVYEFTGSACIGYTVNFRFVLESEGEGGSTNLTDMRTTNFEASGGDLFRFTSETFTNQVLTEDVAGAARRGAEALTVELEKPSPQIETLPRQAIFPSDHLRKIIEAGERGQRILAVDTYDGSDGGTHLYRTTTVIGNEITEPPSGDEAAIGATRRWPVVVSYFDAAKNGDLTPDYSTSFVLWDGGVSTRMRLDYGDFALKGDMVHFEKLPVSGNCPAVPPPREAPQLGPQTPQPAPEGGPVDPPVAAPTSLVPADDGELRTPDLAPDAPSSITPP